MPSLLVAVLSLGLGLIGGTAYAAQAPSGTIRVEVAAAGSPVAGATVWAGAGSTPTDASGVATLTVPPGSVHVVATKNGYESAAARVDVVAGQERAVRLVLVLTAKPTEGEEAPVVASTRTGLRINDQAVRVELLERSQIEETMLITPGNIVKALDETSALRVQTTSVELGLAMARMRGLRGQYTRMLSDGVPLYFDHPGGLAPLQIPPMDLDRIEVISGGASALYGANALAGAVNLLSRGPGTKSNKEPNREFLINQSTEDATDAVLWLASPPTGSWSRTFLVSAHRQTEHDVDADGWSDIPGYSRGVARQRVFWDNRAGKSVWGTAGATFEKREGGSAVARQSLETRGADGQLSGQMPFGRYVLAGTGTLFVQSRTRDFDDLREHERRESSTIEIELRGATPRQTWVAGIAVDWFAIRSENVVLASKYVSTRPGLFVHDDVKVSPWLSVSGSARLDYHNIYDLVFSPRGSARVHRGPWSARISADRSYFAPIPPLNEETEAAGLTRLKIDEPLEMETARSVSGDLTYETRATAVTFTVFHSHLDNPALIDRATYTLRSDDEPIVTHGVEILGTVRRPPFSLIGTYTYLRSREGGGREVALTPRHNAGLVATAEADGRGRLSLRVSFTGVQRLDANPYRSEGEPYATTSLLGEIPFGRWRVFVTADNLTDVRQSDWDPIARPARDVDGRWTVDAWAPLAGRVVNAGLRVLF
jgi:outer membrane receptor for ferrienterochelin and colicins